MDIAVLHSMAAAAAQGARRTLEGKQPKDEALVYIEEYNQLAELAHGVIGEEARLLFQPLNLRSGGGLHALLAIKANSYENLQLASARLDSLEAYLRSQLGTADKDLLHLLYLIESQLRPAIFQKPEEEREVQNALETILRVSGSDYVREQVVIYYSGKGFRPDFILESLDLALEVKFCNSDQKRQRIVDEINADIPAYKTRYQRIVFVVFDLGFIRDAGQFKSGIELNTDVHVTVIKM